MKKVIALLLIIALMVTYGCSKEAAEDTGKQEVAVDSTADTLAAKRFPVRNENNTFATIETNFGSMTLELYRDVAPAHADSFAARTKDGFYNGLEFFRVIDNFMIQGGDPNNNGTGNAGYYLNAEFSDLPHQDGTLSMARASSPNSASCQFFICLSRNRMVSSLDNEYTVFGQLIKGYDVLSKIGSTPVEPNPMNPQEQSHPVEKVIMTKVFISDVDGNPLEEN